MRHSIFKAWLCAGLTLSCVLEALGAETRGILDRPFPPPGIALSEDDRAELSARAKELEFEFELGRLRWQREGAGSGKGTNAGLPTEARLDLLPDVEIFHKAVTWALEFNEFFRSNEVRTAQAMVERGLERIRALRQGQAPWTTATGLVVRAYRSRLDGSIQPYGLVIPASFHPKKGPYRLDVWLHGRDPQLTELKFLEDRLKSPGQFAPPDTIVLHPYGRYCNAFKFAGEMDVLEALQDVRRRYPIDDRRTSIRGFSMGGGGTWHLAVHYPGLWTAAAPGAGFAETADFTKVLQTKPAPWEFEQTLWHWYDATDYAANLFNCPVIAYSGEQDKQIQAAQVMSKSMAAEGLSLVHLIGPKTGHQYEPETKKELSRLFDALMAPGKDLSPPHVRFTTWTLRYPRSHWVQVDGLERHWERASVDANITQDATIEVTTTNVSAMTLFLAPRVQGAPARVKALIDGQIHRLAQPTTSKSTWSASFQKKGERWRQVKNPTVGAVRKHPGLQGPIDDAFMDRFLMVTPTGDPLHAGVGQWVQTELCQATNDWRDQFRGLVPLRADSHVTQEDILANHLILWGDPQSNLVLQKILKKLPVRWNATELVLAGRSFPASDHVPVLIFPNPLNPKRYVVLNSGFTFPEGGQRSNAFQTPKLPDWAVVDIRVPTADRLQQGIPAAGFFNESWK